MGPYLFGYPWLLWAWSPPPEDVHVQHVRRAQASRSWRIFGRRRGSAPATQDHSLEPSDDISLWPRIMLLLPVTEDDLIAFGRELEATDDVVGQLLTEC